MNGNQNSSETGPVGKPSSSVQITPTSEQPPGPAAPGPPMMTPFNPMLMPGHPMLTAFQAAFSNPMMSQMMLSGLMMSQMMMGMGPQMAASMMGGFKPPQQPSPSSLPPPPAPSLPPTAPTTSTNSTSQQNTPSLSHPSSLPALRPTPSPLTTVPPPPIPPGNPDLKSPTTEFTPVMGFTPSEFPPGTNKQQMQPTQNFFMRTPSGLAQPPQIPQGGGGANNKGFVVGSAPGHNHHFAHEKQASTPTNQPMNGGGGSGGPMTSTPARGSGYNRDMLPTGVQFSVGKASSAILRSRAAATQNATKRTTNAPPPSPVAIPAFSDFAPKKFRSITPWPRHMQTIRSLLRRGDCRNALRLLLPFSEAVIAWDDVSLLSADPSAVPYNSTDFQNELAEFWTDVFEPSKAYPLTDADIAVLCYWLRGVARLACLTQLFFLPFTSPLTTSESSGSTGGQISIEELSAYESWAGSEAEKPGRLLVVELYHQVLSGDQSVDPSHQQMILSMFPVLDAGLGFPLLAGYPGGGYSLAEMNGQTTEFYNQSDYFDQNQDHEGSSGIVVARTDINEDGFCDDQNPRIISQDDESGLGRRQSGQQDQHVEEGSGLFGSTNGLHSSGSTSNGGVPLFDPQRHLRDVLIDDVPPSSHDHHQFLNTSLSSLTSETNHHDHHDHHHSLPHPNDFLNSEEFSTNRQDLNLSCTHPLLSAVAAAVVETEVVGNSHSFLTGENENENENENSYLLQRRDSVDEEDQFLTAQSESIPTTSTNDFLNPTHENHSDFQRHLNHVHLTEDEREDQLPFLGGSSSDYHQQQQDEEVPDEYSGSGGESSSRPTRARTKRCRDEMEESCSSSSFVHELGLQVNAAIRGSTVVSVSAEVPDVSTFCSAFAHSTGAFQSSLPGDFPCFSFSQPEDITEFLGEHSVKHCHSGKKGTEDRWDLKWARIRYEPESMEVPAGPGFAVLEGIVRQATRKNGASYRSWTFIRPY